MPSQDIITVLRQLKEKGHLEPYIGYIRFPYYRNLQSGLKVDFDFPLTVIVGKNGTNKSSVLRAVYGCPLDYNVGNFWFATHIDPISDEGGRPRFIYSYYQQEAGRNVEVIKTRIQRTFIKQKNKLNPDYWEPSRPLVSDGMEKMPEDTSKDLKGRTKTRWHLMKKNVVFIDFRSEISAFDKYFYHGDLKQTLNFQSKQDFIRQKSMLIKEAIEKDLSSKKMYKGKKEYLFENRVLNEEQVSMISRILGRKYESVRYIKHRFFKKVGVSVILTSSGHAYSEAFAGSGEFAVAMLVVRVMEAEKGSLIILDEPEVSLHPGAQERLVDFLMEQIKTKKHQIVMGTHSPYIINGLPSEAVKTLYYDQTIGKIRSTSSTSPSQAFFELEMRQGAGKTIFVEDKLAAEIVKLCLKELGQHAYEVCDVQYLPGGGDDMLGYYLPNCALTARDDALFFLDEDKKPNLDFADLSDVKNLGYAEASAFVEKVLGSVPKIPRDGGATDAESQKKEAYIKILEFCFSRLRYLPGYIPEKFVWENMDREKLLVEGTGDFEELSNFKDRFLALTRLYMGKEDYESVTSDEIFQIQKQCLATIDVGKLSDTVKEIERFLE